MLPKTTGIFRIHTKEQKFLQDGTSIVSLNLVASSKYKTKQGQEKEDVCWITATSFGKRSEIIMQHFQEKDRIYIVGDLKQENWTDQQTQQKRSKHTLKIDSFEFIERKNDNQAPANDYSQPAPQPASNIPEIDVGEDIPFAPIGMSEGGYYVHLI